MEKILVVNNDFDTMTLLKELLEKKLYKVKYTSDGEASIQMAKQYEPDVMLVDILQKEWIKELKKHTATATIPVILMTGYNWDEKINKVEADDIIEKPFCWNSLSKKSHVPSPKQKLITLQLISLCGWNKFLIDPSGSA